MKEKEVDDFRIYLSHSYVGRFIVENGHTYEPTRLPRKWGRPLQNQLCFDNCQTAVTSDDPLYKDMLYVEGYAMGIIPIYHAWCTNDNNRAIDITWPRGSGTFYMGIAFSPAFVDKYRADYPACVCLLDDWRNDWPIIRGKYSPQQWRMNDE